MHLLHTALYALLGTAFVFAVIELGLSGYVQSRVKISAPPIVGFLIFCSVWTMLVTAGALFVSWFFARQGPLSRSLSTIMAVCHLLTYFVTMVFWLAGFADLANLLGGRVSSSDYLNAIIAFAVLLWLIFLAMFILNILAVLNVLQSDWPGHTPFKDQSDSNTAPAPGPESPYPMQTTAA